jgi:HK97 gp10 family phage protein
MTVHSISSFITHLSAMAEKVLLAEHQALKKAAEVVEAEAKSEFGVYQGQVGQFAKWDELAESTKTDRVLQGYTENDPLLRSGKLRDSISNKVYGLTAVIGSTDDVMVYQELGTPTIPPRAVLGPALLRKDKKVLEIVGIYTAGAMLQGSEFSFLPTIRGVS